MPRDTHTPTRAYALEAFQGSTGLYADPARERFIMVIKRSLSEGERVESSRYGHPGYVVTWGEAESVPAHHLGWPYDTAHQRYAARAAAQVKVAA